MRRALKYLRLVAYACGLAGLALTLWSQSAGAGIVWLATVSRILLGAMFLLFIAVYVLQALARPARRRPADPGPPTKTPDAGIGH